MRTSIIRLLSLMLAVIPMTVSAQKNIINAFEALIKCPEAQVTESHTLDKDPDTGTKTGQKDVYNFVIPANKVKLIENVVAAFGKDSEMAYSINQGKAVKTDKSISLSVGDGSRSGVRINSPEYEYIYSLFLAPLSENPDGIYRYAYGLSYKEEKGMLSGKLAVTYATTLKHRQKVAHEERLRNLAELAELSDIQGISGLTTAMPSQESWFDLMMSYFQGMESASPQTRIALASKAYKVICDTSRYSGATAADKDAVREILKGLISDKNYSETVLNRLLNKCLTEIR